MCQVLKVSSSGLYKWLHRTPSNRDVRTQELSVLIKDAFEKSDQIYGSPRVWQELRNSKKTCISRSYVARLMKRMHLRSKVRKKYVVTTDSNHAYDLAENLLQRDFSADGICQKWVGDITYIKTGTGWLYLTTVIDLADRKIVGYSFSNDMTANNTVINALKMAIKIRRARSGLIFHSDRGVQYACKDFTSLLKSNGIKPSMSRKGNCWDNAVAESFFKTLKTELVYHCCFKNKEMAKLHIFRYIEGFYHSRRFHSALGGKTPNQMEQFYKAKEKLAA